MPVWPVVHPLGDLVLHSAIPVMVQDGAHRTIDGKLLPVDAKARKLRVEVREIATLKEGIVAETDAGDDVRSTERNLLSLREIFIDSTIEDHFSDYLHGDELLGPYLRGVQDVEVEVVLPCLCDDLYAEEPLWACASSDSLFEIFTVEV